jgi:hypothetical protein
MGVLTPPPVFQQNTTTNGLLTLSCPCPCSDPTVLPFFEPCHLCCIWNGTLVGYHHGPVRPPTLLLIHTSPPCRSHSPPLLKHSSLILLTSFSGGLDCGCGHFTALHIPLLHERSPTFLRIATNGDPFDHPRLSRNKFPPSAVQPLHRHPVIIARLGHLR